METSFVDVRAADDPRWPQLNEAALRLAHGITGEHGSWCLISRWRDDSSLDENWDQHRRALPISHSQRVEMTEGRTEVRTTIAFRIAKLLEVSLHDVIQGIALPKPTCPHCGKVIG